jgi:sodium transport system ATP-binding protein
MVGAVGAGKTTLARLLAAVQEPSVGSIEISGFDTSLHPLKARRCLGYRRTRQCRTHS